MSINFMKKINKIFRILFCLNSNFNRKKITIINYNKILKIHEKIQLRIQKRLLLCIKSIKVLLIKKTNINRI